MKAQCQGGGNLSQTKKLLCGYFAQEYSVKWYNTGNLAWIVQLENLAWTFLFVYVVVHSGHGLLLAIGILCAPGHHFVSMCHQKLCKGARNGPLSIFFTGNSKIGSQHDKSNFINGDFQVYGAVIWQ